MTTPDPDDIPESPGWIDIDVIVRDPGWEADVGNVTDVCRASACAAFAAGVSRPLVAEAALVLADDEFVATLNKQYRGREGATNVLSFAAMDEADAEVALPAGMPVMLGDIIVARETTVREAAEMGLSVEHHLRHLVVHGLLHLLGYDHLTDEDAAEMEPMETHILGAMGVADPYGGDAGQTSECQ